MVEAGAYSMSVQALASFEVRQTTTYSRVGHEGGRIVARYREVVRGALLDLNIEVRKHLVDHEQDRYQESAATPLRRPLTNH